MSTRNTTATPTRPAPGGFATPGPLAPIPNNSNVPAVVRSGPRQLIKLDTLGGQFRGLVLLSILLAVITLAASYLVLTNIDNNFTDIITNTAPSITAAQRLGQAIQDADAQAANYQLTSRVDVTSPDYDPKVYGDKGLRAQAWNTFLLRRQEVTDLLFLARKNITFEGEADAISAIEDRFLEYVSRISVMKYELDQGNREAALAAYKSAHDLLVGNLNNVQLDNAGRTPEEISKLSGWADLSPAPNASLSADRDCRIDKKLLGIEANIQKLSGINTCHLQRASDDASRSVSTLTFAVIALNVLLVVVLVFLSFRSAGVTHRLINPGYFVALIGAIVVAVILSLNLLQAKTDFNTVAVDSFASIDAAAKIRQLGADANADESRLLLSPETPGLDTTNPALTADVRKAFQSATLQDNFDKKFALLQKQLDVAWNNVTYNGERVALCKVAQNSKAVCSGSSFALDDYLKQDKDIRTSFSKGLLSQAIATDTTKSAASFSQVDLAIRDLSKVNETEFDRTACNAVGMTQFGGQCSQPGYINTWLVGIWVVFPLIALASLAGYWFVRREF